MSQEAIIDNGWNFGKRLSMMGVLLNTLLIKFLK